MNAKTRKQLARRKRRIERRLAAKRAKPTGRPAFAASNIHYEIGDRDRGLAHGGIGAFHLLAKRIGLVEAIDDKLHLLKFHLPYHESDHVLNFAYNCLASRGVSKPKRKSAWASTPRRSSNASRRHSRVGHVIRESLQRQQADFTATSDRLGIDGSYP